MKLWIEFKRFIYLCCCCCCFLPCLGRWTWELISTFSRFVGGAGWYIRHRRIQKWQFLFYKRRSPGIKTATWYGKQPWSAESPSWCGKRFHFFFFFIRFKNIFFLLFICSKRWVDKCTVTATKTSLSELGGYFDKLRKDRGNNGSVQT